MIVPKLFTSSTDMELHEKREPCHEVTNVVVVNEYVVCLYQCIAQPVDAAD